MAVSNTLITQPSASSLTTLRKSRSSCKLNAGLTGLVFISLVTQTVNSFVSGQYPTIRTVTPSQNHNHRQQYSTSVLEARRSFGSPSKKYRGLNATRLEDDNTVTKRRRRESRFKIRRRVKSALHSATDNDTTWSRSSTSTEKSSVRSRVRQVLAKAKGRTGIRNGSEKKGSSRVDDGVFSVVDAASIGGLGSSYDGLTSSSTFDYVPSNTTDAAVAAAAGVCDEIAAFSGDVSAAFSVPASPLPFQVPKLSPDQKRLLRGGERVQFQTEMGLEGKGYVVIDVRAQSNVVWDCLLDFNTYPDLIPTVREVEMYTNTHLNEDYYHEDKVEYEDGSYAILKHGIPSVTRAAFTLSKFKLKIAAIHKYRPHPQGDYMIFSLDPANRNIVLQNAKGIWHTQSNPDGRGEEYTRVWLLCELRVSKMLPKFIVDYAAKKAMPRATSWLKPQVETAASLWLKDSK